jgi:putative hemolysin
VVGSTIFAGLVVLFAQLLPRALARRWPSQVAPVVLPVLRGADLVTTPILEGAHALVHRWLPPKAEVTPVPERDSIQDLLREGELEGIGEREEIAIISGVVEFSEKRVGNVMTAREEIFSLDADLDPHAIASQIAQSGYSRVPVYRGSIDNIVGMIHAFDVIKARGEPLGNLRPVTFSTPESPCNELLFRMLRERLHLAVVRDPSGRTLGLVTLEDLLEELVGDIRDEHDEPGPSSPPRTQSK